MASVKMGRLPTVPCEKSSARVRGLPPAQALRVKHGLGHRVPLILEYSPQYIFGIPAAFLLRVTWPLGVASLCHFVGCCDGYLAERVRQQACHSGELAVHVTVNRRSWCTTPGGKLRVEGAVFFD